MTVTPKDLAETLRREYRAERKELAAERVRVREALVKALDELEVSRRVWLVGSLTHEGWGRASDVDLVIEGMGHREVDDLWSSLSRRLSVPLEILRLEELSEGFRKRVLEEGEVVRDAAAP